MTTSHGPYVRSTVASLLKLPQADVTDLVQASDALIASYDAELQVSKKAMLPSYTHRLPSGTEQGTAVALDLGGSTLRVAIIKLKPHEAKAELAGSDKSHIGDVMSVLARHSWIVDDDVKKLAARDFFDWIVGRIASVLSSAGAQDGLGMSMGVTWSFPVEPTSAASGKVQKMGKGYTQWMSILDTDLKSHFEASFRRNGLRLRMTALLNDTEATLLSHAYANPATRISLIWGTGINAAMYLPIERVSEKKLGVRPTTWTKAARAVIVNTELSMFGAGVFPMSEADTILDRNSSNPGFQPLEQMTSGRYLGEVFRLLLLGAIKHGELFGGRMPDGFLVPFSLDTASMNAVEDFTDLGAMNALLENKFKFNFRPTQQDLEIMRTIGSAISLRAATYLAVAIFGLYKLQQGHEQVDISPALPTNGPGAQPPVAVAYCGAVAEKHSTARNRCQEMLDRLMQQEDPSPDRRRLVLEAADDSGLLGAAVGAVIHATERSTRAKI